MWVKTKNNKFDEYGIKIDKQRKLADDESLMHMELQDNPQFFIDIREDLEVKLFTNDEMDKLAKVEDDVEGEQVKTKLEKKALIEAKELEILNARIEAKLTRDDLLSVKEK